MEIQELEIRTKSQYNISPLIQKRWSPRAFSGEAISQEIIDEIFHAASWAASAMNEQPWQYIYGTKGTKGFDKLWDCLNPGNQPWTKHAGLIFVALKRNTFEANGKPNPWGTHDVGMANAQLLLQAASRDIYGHLMAGFDDEKIKRELNLSDNLSPVCMGVLGHIGNPELLDEPYRSRELITRTRKPLNEVAAKL